MKKYLFQTAAILLLLPSLTVGQSINTEFGKNRVQFHDDFNDWWMYETENFITYWYGKSKQVAIPAMQMAEVDHDQIQKVLEHRMNDKIEMIVYTDLSDLKQSNIGTEETFASKGGETKIVGNKMFIYFDGDHNHMRQKIKEGIASVYFNNMLFGSNLQEILQNAVLLNLPEWYKQGIVSYAASPWDAKAESELREIWNSNPKFRQFDKMAQNFPRQAGHALWYYIEQNYGRSSISNIIYLTKINRGVNNAFEYILNKGIKDLKEEWNQYFEDYFAKETNAFAPLTVESSVKLKSKKKNRITKMSSSPDGKLILYSHNHLGKYRIVLYDVEAKSSKTIFRYGHNNHFQETDYQYPLLAWHPNGKEFSYVYEHKDVIKLVRYRLENKEKKEQIIPTAFQRIYSFDYVNDLDYIFSANVDGFSDLHYYKSKNRNHGNITTDFYDDLDAINASFDGKNGIMFISNRQTDSIVKRVYDTILPIGNFDIYFLPEGETKAINLTNTPNISEKSPKQISDIQITYTSDVSGINNLYVWNTISLIAQPLTNLDRDIACYEIIKQNQYLIHQFRDNRFSTHLSSLDKSLINVTNTQSTAKADRSELSVNRPDVTTPNAWKVDYEFQSTYDDPNSHTPLVNKSSVADFPVVQTYIPVGLQPSSLVILKRVDPYNNSRAVAANKRFGFTNIVTKLDNDILFEGLESYTGDRSEVLNTPMGILFRSTVKDLFEDYSIDAGIRIPTTFNGSEAFLVFDNKKSRIDKRYAIYRKTTKYDTSDPSANFALRSQKTSILGMYQLKYPFHIYSSVRATSAIRFDKFHQLSTENLSFEAPNINEKRISLKLEYIYDNTFDASLNIKHGLRLKVFNEAINEFDINVIDGFDFDLAKGFTNVTGYDVRYYLPLLKKSVLAFRSSAATSFGSKKMLYYLGGVENNLIRRFDNSIPLPEQGDFAYKVNAFHLRGFNSNIRNGSTFAVFNSEVRIPAFQYLLGPGQGSAFLRNLQFTGFFDAGVAFYGANPFAEENILNKVVIESPPLIKIEVEYFRDPLVMGVGYGLRTQIFGYFVKIDHGYGIETRKIQKPILYVSIGMDF